MPPKPDGRVTEGELEAYGSNRLAYECFVENARLRLVRDAKLGRVRSGELRRSIVPNEQDFDGDRRTR